MSEENLPVIAVIGSLNLDYVSRVEYLPSPGETVPSDSLNVFHGGKGANQAIAASRQGSQVRFLGALGSDIDGASYRKALEEEGIDTSDIKTVEGKTGTAMITVDELGENTIVTSSGANESVTVAMVGEAAASIESANALLGQFETPLPALIEAVRTANTFDIPAIINPSPFIPTFPWQEIHSEYVIVNENEAIDLLEFPPESESLSTVRQRLHEMRIESLIITRGSNNTLVYTHTGELIEVPTLPVLPIDTVGAGDAFAGCFAARIASGDSLDESIRAANCAGALTTLGVGAQDPIPDREQVNQHIEHLVNHA